MTSKVLDIRSHRTRYGYYKEIKFKDDSDIIHEYTLYNAVKDLKVGETYTFRIMKKTDTAIAISNKNGDELF